MTDHETIEELEYSSALDCPHNNVTWVEEIINENPNVQWIGYKCDDCGSWVDKDDNDEQD